MADSSFPKHLLPFGDTQWAVWRRNALRGAGFPADAVLPLASPELATAADRVLDAEAQLETTCAQARTTVDTALDALRRDSGWDDASRRKPLLAARRAAVRGEPDGLRELGLDTLANALTEIRQALAQARGDLTASFETALTEQAEAIYAVARNTRFREAVLWQNRAAFHTGVEPIATRPPAGSKPDAERRYAEKMVASYLQRYTVKNDTIGFFGPSVPFLFKDDGPALSARPGADLIASSRVFFEAWCLDELARPFASQELMRPWLRPHRSPLARLDGNRLHQPGQAPRPLPAPQAAVFAACDGKTTAHDVALALIADPTLGFSEAKQVYAVLDQLLRQELISWDFGLPATPIAAEAFAAQIAATGHPKLRAVGQHALDTLERARGEVAASLGDPEALDQALERLDVTFKRFTGTAPTRRAGQVYGARTLVYLDCLRDIEVTCGPEIRRELAAPLGLVLDAVRWLSHEVATAMRPVLLDIYRGLARHGGGTVEGIPFLQTLEHRLSDSSFLEPTRGRLAERWGELLGTGPCPHRLDLKSAGLRERAAELFACPGAGWPLARCHSPDVMIAAPSVEAVCAGQYQLVLGEIHVGMNTLNSWAFLGVWPEREQICREIELDVPEPRLFLIRAKDNQQLTTRATPTHYPPQELMVPSDTSSSIRLPEREVPAIEMVVEEDGGRVIVRARDGSHRMDAVQALGLMLSKLTNSEIGLFPEQRHAPRITLDRLVLQRESWILPASELMAFAGLKNTQERFLATRRWVRALGLPRFVFVKSALERKPIYVDFASQIYVELLVKLARRAAAESRPEREQVLKLSEMLPAPDELWLPDAEDRRYCSELRLVVIDRHPLAPI